MATRTSQSAARGLKLRWEERPNEAIIHCAGRILAENAELFQKEVLDLIPASRGHVAGITSRIVVDLSNVTHVDSTGLGALLGAWQAAQAKGCELEIINLSPRVAKTVEMTKLGSVLNKLTGLIAGHDDTAEGQDRRKLMIPPPPGSPVRSDQDRRQADRRRSHRRSGVDRRG